jgi:hypothetical protein
MNGTSTPTLNSRRLHTAIGRPLPPESELDKIPLDPIVYLAFPFTELVMVSVRIRCDHTSLGLRLNTPYLQLDQFNTVIHALYKMGGVHAI